MPLDVRGNLPSSEVRRILREYFNYFDSASAHTSNPQEPPGPGDNHVGLPDMAAIWALEMYSNIPELHNAALTLLRNPGMYSELARRAGTSFGGATLDWIEFQDLL
jgi:hypothetical protein